MKFINLIQGSPEWFAYRRSRIGASDCAGIMNESPFSTPRKVFREKMFGDTKTETPAMKQGREREQEARMLYNEMNGTDFKPAIIEHTCGYVFASLDGISGDLSLILEIKVVGKKTWDEVNEGNIPRYIQWQVQQQLYCTPSAKKVILWVCHPIGDELVGIDLVIERDPFMQAQFYKLDDFYTNHMLAMTEPEPVDADLEERDDLEWLKLASERVQIDAEMKKLEYLDKINREKMIACAQGKPCKGGGVTLTPYPKKGLVDYKLIPELKGIDLEKYRKASTEVWRISCDHG